MVEFGDTLKQMADVKYALDDNVKQNFLEPLHQLQMKDLKEVMVSRRRTHSRSILIDRMIQFPVSSITVKSFKAVG